MLDDLLGQLFGEAVFGRLSASRRAKLLARLFFGLLGTGLGLAGAWHVATSIQTPNLAMHASMVALMICLACFCLFNIALARNWRWPGLLFVTNVVLLFVTRLAFGP